MPLSWPDYGRNKNKPVILLRSYKISINYGRVILHPSSFISTAFVLRKKGY